MKISKVVRFSALFLAFILLLFSSGVFEKKLYQADEDGYDCVFGIIFYGFPEMNEILSNSVFQYTAYLEENFNVKFEFASTLLMSHTEAVETLCDAGVDVILNASTQAIPEGFAICEEHQVYWLQIFDMPTDTDIVNQFEKSQYYLGYIINHEEPAAKAMATTMLDMGMNQIGVVTYPESLSTSNIHAVRSNAIQKVIHERAPEAINFVLKISSVKSGLESMANQNYRPDSLIFTTKTSSFTIDELKELFKNPQLKIAYFDLNPSTRQELLDGDCLTVSCGQHNIIGLGFAYAYHYLTSDYLTDNKLALTSDYIILTSVEEYDQYMKYLVDSMPYSAEELSRMISSLDTSVEMIMEYSDSYSLSEIVEKKSNH